jgi:ATP-dependent HslUV protease ATP-binding subunit HslU
MEKLLEDLLFQAPDSATPHVMVDAASVRDRLSAIVADQDLSRYIL